MPRWARDLNATVLSRKFRIGLVITHASYFSIYLTYKLIVESGPEFLLYVIFHLYGIISATIGMVYNTFPDELEEFIEKHTKPNGDVEGDFFVGMFLLAFGFGPASIPNYAFRNRRDQCQGQYFGRFLFYLPGLGGFIAVILLPPLADDERGALFIFFYIIYVHFWIYIFAETMLTICRWTRYLVYFNLATFVFALGASMYFGYRQGKMENPDDDMEIYVLEGVIQGVLDQRKYKQEYMIYEDEEQQGTLDIPDFRNTKGENFFEMLNRIVPRGEGIDIKRRLSKTIIAEEESWDQENPPERTFSRGYSMRGTGYLNFNQSQNQEWDET